MKYSKLPGVDLPVSDIIFGCCNPMLICDDPGAEELLDLAYSTGFNCFDTAKVYGKSEDVIGRWMKRTGVRENVVIITKGCHPDSMTRINVKSLKEDIESSLCRLQTNYIDIYMLHRDDPAADIEPVFEALNGYVRRGVIRKIGVSNWKHNRIEDINRLIENHGWESITVSSPQMSLVRQKRDPWGSGCVSISWDEEAIQWYRNHPDISVFAYSCLGHGILSGKTSSNHPMKLYRSLDSASRKGFYCLENIKRLRLTETVAQRKGCSVAQVALSWCMSRGFKVFPIATMSTIERIKENIGSLEVEVSDKEIKCLEESIV